MRNYKRNNGRVEYKRTSDFGRVWVSSNCGLQMIRREVRHTIAGHLYVDIDVANCQPTILNQVLLTHNYNDFKTLNSYIENRSEYLAQIQNTYNVDKSAAKHLINIVLYGGSFKTWLKLNDVSVCDRKLNFIRQLQDEIKSITSIVVELSLIHI